MLSLLIRCSRYRVNYNLFSHVCIAVHCRSSVVSTHSHNPNFMSLDNEVRAGHAGQDIKTNKGSRLEFDLGSIEGSISFLVVVLVA